MSNVPLFNALSAPRLHLLFHQKKNLTAVTLRNFINMLILLQYILLSVWHVMWNRNLDEALILNQEAGMAIHMEGTDVFLGGDWSIAGVVGHIDTLSDVLQQFDKQGEKKLRVDCGQIKSIDINGLQVLKVWLQCARFRGMEPKMVNLSEGMQRIMLVSGFTPSDAGLCLDGC